MSFNVDIYQKIWDADQNENGVRAILPKEARNEDRGYVVVDEKISGSDKEHKLIPEVKIPASKMNTYTLCTKLFNNYTLNNFSKESTVSANEEAEVNAFIDAIKDTGSMRLAREFREQQLGRDMSDAEWISALKEIWFREYELGSAPSRNGFEHVFVGEQKGGSIGGYHFWYKYYLDDKAGVLGYGDGEDNIDYNGTKYGGSVTNEEGITNPDSATLSYTWDAYDYEKKTKATGLVKRVGGFWIGPSPEGLIALGTVCFFQSTPNSRLSTEINSNQYDLKLFKDPQSKSINTFYAVLKGVTVRPITSPESPDEKKPRPTPPTEDAPRPPIRIIAALPNPEGSDTDKETVTLVNIGSSVVDIKGWSIAGNNDNAFEIASNSKLDGGEFRTYRLPSRYAQLTNKAGATITLSDANGTLVQQVTYKEKPASGETVLFSQD